MTRITIDAEVLRALLADLDANSTCTARRLRHHLGCIVPVGATVHAGSRCCLIGTRGCVTVHGDPPAKNGGNIVARAAFWAALQEWQATDDVAKSVYKDMSLRAEEVYHDSPEHVRVARLGACLLAECKRADVHFDKPRDAPAAEPRSGVVRELGRIADALEVLNHPRPTMPGLEGASGLEAAREILRQAGLR